MSRRRKDPLRSLTDDARRELTRLSHSRTAPAARVARAVADGSDYQQAARAAGRRSGDAVSRVVARFNREGLAALDPRHGGGTSRPTTPPPATGSYARPRAPRRPKPTAPPRGR